LKTGFIGYGNMGGALLRSLLAAGAIDAGDVMVSTRTGSRLEGLLKEYPGLATGTNVAVARECARLFICVRTGEVKGVMEEIVPHLHRDAHLVYICAGLEIKNLAKLFAGKITKVVPSMTSEVGAGVSLVCHNGLVDEKDRASVEAMLGKIGRVKTIPEDHFEVGADLTSCAPAFIACLCEEFARAGARHSDFTVDEAWEMVVATLYGTAKLLFEKQTGSGEIIRKVATPGGISAEGLKVLARELPAVFDRLFEATLKKHETVKEAVSAEYTRRD